MNVFKWILKSMEDSKMTPKSLWLIMATLSNLYWESKLFTIRLANFFLVRLCNVTYCRSRIVLGIQAEFSCWKGRPLLRHGSSWTLQSFPLTSFCQFARLDWYWASYSGLSTFLEDWRSLSFRRGSPFWLFPPNNSCNERKNFLEIQDLRFASVNL